MCGRYYIDDETSKEIRKILEQIDAKLGNQTRKSGEIVPSKVAPVLRELNGGMEPDLFTWGFPNFNNKGVVINARAETVFEKRLFRESLTKRRCIIPANGFYEWDKSKNKIYFTQKNTSIIYMAGIYNTYDGVNRFVILTTSANAAMEDVHDRMPLILDQERIQPWLFDNQKTEEIVRMIPPILDRSAEYYQRSLELS